MGIEQPRIQPGDYVLIHGGAGGVGAFAVQIAKVLGARTSATASAGDIDYVRSLGADLVVDYRATPFEQVVRDVDVVLDPIGGRTAVTSIDVLNDGGTLISLAAPQPVTLPEGRNLSARFFIVEADRGQLMELARLADEGRLRVEVAEVFALEAAAEAYAYGRSAHRRGKVVLQLAHAKAAASTGRRSTMAGGSASSHRRSATRKGLPRSSRSRIPRLSLRPVTASQSGPVSLSRIDAGVPRRSVVPVHATLFRPDPSPSLLILGDRTESG